MVAHQCVHRIQLDSACLWEHLCSLEERTASGAGADWQVPAGQIVLPRVPRHRISFTLFLFCRGQCFVPKVHMDK